jgi:hypothetical protein
MFNETTCTPTCEKDPYVYPAYGIVQSFFYNGNVRRSQDKAIRITTGCGLDDREIVVGVQAQVGSRIFSHPRRPAQFWGAMGTGGSFPGDIAAGA